MKIFPLLIVSVVASGFLGCFDSTCEGTDNPAFGPIVTIFEESADLSNISGVADLALQAADLHNECFDILSTSTGTYFGWINTIGWDGVAYDNTFWRCDDGVCNEIQPLS